VSWRKGDLSRARRRPLPAEKGIYDPPGRAGLDGRDIITTGLSSRETLEALAEHPGTIIGAACLIDRSGGKAEIGVRRVGLATLDIPAYPADALQPQLAAIPAVKPGSRALEERKFAFPI
jgi:orotate phosphoribosyltransferase